MGLQKEDSNGHSRRFSQESIVQKTGVRTQRKGVEICAGEEELYGMAKKKEENKLGVVSLYR